MPLILTNALDNGRSASVPVPPSGAYGLGERWIETLEPLHSWATDENGHGMITDGVAKADKPAATSARKPTFLQRESGRPFRKSGARGCRLERLSGNWKFTGAPSTNIWMPRVLQRDNPGRLPRRQHLIPSRHIRMTFTLNTYADIYPEQRQSQPDDRPAQVAHFTAALYTQWYVLPPHWTIIATPRATWCPGG